MSRLLARLLPLVVLVGLLGAPALAKPVPTLDERDVTVAAAPRHQVLVAQGTFGLRGGSETRVERTFDLDLSGEHAGRVLPLAVSARGNAVTLDVENDAAGTRATSISARQLTGAEGPVRSVAAPPLLYLWSGTAFSEGEVVVGPPADDAGVRAPTGGPDGTVWNETEDPVFHALFAPADVDLAVALAEVPAKWVKSQERSRARTVARPDGLPAWTQKTAVHYLGVTKDRALFEFEVVTSGDVFGGEYTWALTRTAKGSALVAEDGRLFHGHVELTAVVTQGEEKEIHAVVSEIDVKPVDGEAPPAGAARAIADMLRLRRTDPAQFEKKLLHETAATARRLVQAIRDTDGLDGVTVKLWDDSVDIGAVVREARQLADSPLALDVLEEHAPTLVALGVLDASAVEQMRALVPGGSEGLPWAIAFAVPSQKLILIKPDATSDLGTLAHEYAHVISDAKGYVDKARIGLDAKEALDLAFVDVDGAIAAWALEEAQAQVTEEAVKRQMGDPLVYGFALQTYAAALRPPGADLSLFDHLIHLLYYTSPKVIAAAYEKGDTVETSLARAFETYSYRTHQILFPRATTDASVLLFPRALALRGDGGPTGATRVGAFGLQQALFRLEDMDYKAATRLVKELTDDVVLRYPEGHLWVTRWTDARAALRFASQWPVPAEGRGSRTIREDAVVIVHGQVPDADALVEGLLKPVR